MSYLARLFWSTESDQVVDREISKHYLYTHLEKNQINISLDTINKMA